MSMDLRIIQAEAKLSQAKKVTGYVYLSTATAATEYKQLQLQGIGSWRST